MEGEKIRVFCVDDDVATLKFYELVLSFEPDMEFVGSSTSTEGLLQAVEAAKPSVLLLDLLMPGSNTLGSLSDLHKCFHALSILVVSGLEEGEVVAEAFQRGACGFFLKTMDLTDLTSVIRRAASGERVNTGPRPAPLPGRNP